MAKKKESKKEGKKVRKSGGRAGKKQLLNGMALVMALVFMPTTIFLFLAMLPTIVAGVIDRTGKGTMALTVGSMNLAGATPFLLDLWTTGHTVPDALALITNPRTVIVIYCAAGMGYMINWVLSSMVATIMVQHAGLRLKSIKKRQADLVERWGREVTGDVPLDVFGFPIEKKANFETEKTAKEDNE